MSREKVDIAIMGELQRAGAHYVVDTVAELDPILDDIDARLKSADSSLLPLRKGV